MSIVALKPKARVKIITEVVDERYKDKLVTSSGPRTNVEYIIQLPAPGELGSSIAAVMVHVLSPQQTKVGPRLLLEPKSSWDAAFGFHLVSKEYHEWLRVCITLSQAQFSPWLKEYRKAAARAKHWYESGDFEPNEFNEIAWYTAASWPIWRKKGFAWKECVADLQAKISVPLLGNTAASFEAAITRIRKLSGRLGLKKNW